MWDKKKPDNSVPQVNNRPAPQPIAVPPPAVAPAPQPQAFRPPEAGSKGTAIGSAVSIVGDVYSEEDLYVDGEIKGTLQIANSRLTIGPNGKAKSNIRAREVIIQGQVQGDVEASQKITIRKNGSLVGNIKTTGIVIDDDAYFKGSIDIVRKEAEAMSA